MALALYQKLRIKEGFTLLAINEPRDFSKRLGTLPPNVEIVETPQNFDQVHWFVQNKAQMEKELDKVVKLVKADVVCWIYYPKGTSKLQTDLTRDKGWEKFLAHQEMQWLSLISFDDTWSAFGCRLKNESDKIKETQTKEREIFQYADPKTKSIRLPEDFDAALKMHKKQEAFFNTLSFTNRKEYIEWIITAKREETRLQRVKDSIDRLGMEWKNPRNL